jgi:putative oxidoreductase
MSMFESGSPIWSSRMRSILRIVVGALFVIHGTQKLFGFPPNEMMPGPVSLTSMMGAAGLLEVVGGALIILGLLTRPVAFLLAGEMAVAYFTVHHPRALLPISNGGELAVLFCFSFLYLMFAGAGVWSLDAMIARGKRHEEVLDERQRRAIDRVA